MIIIGYLLAVIMGGALGIIGAGGSILTVPILVYFFNVGPVTATAYSLLIVGISALFGSIKYYKKKQINLSTIFLFSIPSVIAVYLTRRFIVPNIPLNLFSLGNFVITKEHFIMLLFASLMIFSSLMMIFDKKTKNSNSLELSSFMRTLIIGVEGFVVGIFTGLVGAGGGFLIIPALVLLVGLEMKIAVGSSLLIIALKSLVGFIGDIQAGIDIDFILVITFTLSAAIGVVIGTIISSYLRSNIVKKIFGIFTLLIAITIILKELYL